MPHFFFFSHSVSVFFRQQSKWSERKVKQQCYSRNENTQHGILFHFTAALFQADCWLTAVSEIKLNGKFECFVCRWIEGGKIERCRVGTSRVEWWEHWQIYDMNNSWNEKKCVKRDIWRSTNFMELLGCSIDVFDRRQRRLMCQQCLSIFTISLHAIQDDQKIVWKFTYVSILVCQCSSTRTLYWTVFSCWAKS